MALAYLEVKRVMAGRHLHRPRAEFQIHTLVGYDRDRAVHDGQHGGLAHEVLPSRVVRVHRHACIAQHGLGAGGRHLYIFWILDFGFWILGLAIVHRPSSIVRYGVANGPQIALLLLVLHFEVGEGGGATGAPVDDALALVDKPFVVQVLEHGAHGFCRARVHGESLASPVARGSQAANLVADLRAVLVHVLPFPLEELLAPQVVAG